MNRERKELVDLAYQVNLKPLSEEDGGGWLAEIPELQGCYSDGTTPEEALSNIKEAKRVWLDTANRRGLQIPTPRKHIEEEYSGKFTLRIPKFLHKELASAAKKDNISLNSYILSLLTLNFGKRHNDSRLKDLIFINEESACWPHKE